MQHVVRLLTLAPTSERTLLAGSPTSAFTSDSLSPRLPEDAADAAAQMWVCDLLCSGAADGASTRLAGNLHRSVSFPSWENRLHMRMANIGIVDIMAYIGI